MQSFIFIDAVSLSDVLHQRMGECGRRLSTHGKQESKTWRNGTGNW